ncbi:tail fiber protein [Vibrio phage vB_VhaP_VH-5]|uniref:Tail fiber protein n=1 Tax=Vibrio phage vB_VhaP_VH-5 TaxID=2660694 RepID=A0A5Q2WCL3_9CAUD|nr:tail fiber protein [Vibrio phage vB_VhaP_VH-5]
MTINNKRSYVEYTVTEPTTDFVITFEDYDVQSQDRITVSIDGVLAESQGYAVMRKNEQVVTITPAVTEGTVRLERETNIDEPFHKFTAGALFSAKSMDENFEQVRHSQQEVRDGFEYLEFNTNGVVQDARAATDRANAAAERAENTDVSQLQTALTSVQDDVSQLQTDVQAQKLDTDIIVTPKFGGVERTQADKNSDIISVKDFGVVGDGVVDDTENLRAYHAYCNSHHIPASYAGLDTVVVQADAQIVVNTDFDHSGAVVKLLNGINTPPAWNTHNIAYRIFDESTPLVRIAGASMDVNERHVNSLYPTKGIFDGTGYVKLYDNSTFIPDRIATGTVTYKQVFQLIKGKALHGLSYPLNGTNVTVDYRLNSPRGTLTIKNINLLNDGSWNNQKLFNIERNRVNIQGFTVQQNANAGGLNTNTLVNVEDAAEFSFDGLVVEGMDNATSGSYIFSANGCAGLYLNRLTAAQGWSWVGTNNTNGVFLSNASLDVYDGHESLHNLFVSNVAFTKEGVKVGWGGGSIIMNNITLHESSAYHARQDYGGWFYGDIIINGVVLKQGYKYRPVVYASYVGSSTQAMWAAKTVTISNVAVADSTVDERKDVYLCLIRAKTDMLAYAPTSVSITNVSAPTSMNILAQVDYGSMRGYGYSFLTLNNIKGRSFKFISEATNTLNDSNPVKLITNLNDVRALNGVTFTSNHPHSTLNFTDCTNITNCTVPQSPQLGIGCKLSFRGCAIANYADASYLGVTSSSSSHYTRLNDCTVGGGFDLTGVDSLQGVRYIGSPTVPSGVDTTTAFMGWVRT